MKTLLLLSTLPAILAICPYHKATQSVAFVDKSELIKIFMGHEISKNFMVTAPRDFGKTTNLLMLKRFFETHRNASSLRRNKDLFKNPELNLSIVHDKDFFGRHFGKYPVIFLNFFTKSDLKTEEQILESLRKCVCNAYSPHKWMYMSDIDKLSARQTYPTADNIREYRRLCQQLDMPVPKGALVNSIKMLADDLSNFYRCGVMLLVDDFELPVLVAMQNFVNSSGINTLLTSILQHPLEDLTGPIHYSLLAGTTDLLLHGTQYGVTNFFHFQFLLEHPMSDYFGFTTTDMAKIYKSKKLKSPVEQEERDYLDRCYDGYVSMTNHTRLYNPGSITLHFENRMSRRSKYIHSECTNLWPKCNNVAKFDLCLENSQINEPIRDLILNKTFELEFKERFEVAQSDNFHNLFGACLFSNGNQTTFYWSLLFELGYFTYTGTPGYVKLPNEEIKQYLAKKLKISF